MLRNSCPNLNADLIKNGLELIFSSLEVSHLIVQVQLTFDLPHFPGYFSIVRMIFAKTLYILILLFYFDKRTNNPTCLFIFLETLVTIAVVLAISNNASSHSASRK